MARRRLVRVCLWKGPSFICLLPDGSEGMWNSDEVYFFWEVDIWSKATYISLKEVVIVLWLTKPWLYVSSGDWCNYCYKVKYFFYASPYKDNKYLFSRPVLRNYLVYLALMELECLLHSRSQSYSTCTCSWTLCVSPISLQFGCSRG